MTTKEMVLDCKAKNPDWGYKRIAQEIGRSPNTIKFHLKESCRIETKVRVRRFRSLKPLSGKLDHYKEFRQRKKNFDLIGDQRKSKAISKFNVEDLLKKLGAEPRCYLTGTPINLNEAASYALDHIIPVFKGGDNSLENCGLTTKTVNAAKHFLTKEEFLELCLMVVKHHGYSVEK